MASDDLYWIVSLPTTLRLSTFPAQQSCKQLDRCYLAASPTYYATRLTPERQEKSTGLDLATTYCPTQLPTQYRRRRGVSRPCSGRERVGPPRGDTRTKPMLFMSLAASSTPASW